MRIDGADVREVDPESLRRQVALVSDDAFLFSAVAGAQTPVTLQDTVKKAIVSNPEVQARWHAFLSSQHEQDVARSAQLHRHVIVDD